MSEDTNAFDDMAWSEYGSCGSADPDLFFPAPGSDTAYARSICRGCPVRSACLDYALETGQKFGIWGGMTENQRRRIRRHDRSTDIDRHVLPATGTAGAPDGCPSPVGRHLHLVE